MAARVSIALAASRERSGDGAGVMGPRLGREPRSFVHVLKG